MKRVIQTLIGILILVALGLIANAAYVVDETEQVVITQFKDPVGESKREPGLYFKLPFIQRAHYFDDRFLEWNGDANQIPTKDKRFIWVDTYARWRITDPLLFYQRVRNEAGAQSRLDDIINGATRNAVASHDLIEVVRSTNREPQVDPVFKGEEISLDDIETGRDEIMAEILDNASSRAKSLGVEILDVRFSRINYNERVRNKVYQRMIAERQRIAERYRSEGQGEAADIRGKKEKELNRIESEAYEEAQGIRGAADAKATRVYAEAYRKAPEFFRFLRTTESYRNVLDEQSSLILSTESEFFRYLDRLGAPAGGGEGSRSRPSSDGVPIPAPGGSGEAAGDAGD